MAAYSDVNCVSADAPRTPEVTASLADLNFATESAHTSAHMLAERLGAVLRPESQAYADEKANEPRCGLATAIRRESSVVYAVNAILRDLLDRLEI